jgi:drug/metabolite transporter (DMT)-like permease
MHQTTTRDRVDATAIWITVALCATWGLQQVSVKVAIAQGLPPALHAALRSAIAAICVLGWVAHQDGRAGIADLFARPTLRPGLVIALSFTVQFLLLYPGLHLTTASRGVLFLYTAPFFTALGAQIFLPAERLNLMQFGGLLLAFAGVAAAFADGLAGGGGSLVGDAMCLGAGALWGITTVIVKASPGLSRAPFAKVLFLQLAGSAPPLFLASWLFGEMQPWPQPTALAWAGLFYQTVIVAFISYLVWFRLILIYPANRIAGFTFLTPLFGILAGALLLGERATWALLAGLVAIAAGMWLVNARAGTAK